MAGAIGSGPNGAARKTGLEQRRDGLVVRHTAGEVQRKWWCHHCRRAGKMTPETADGWAAVVAAWDEHRSAHPEIASR